MIFTFFWFHLLLKKSQEIPVQEIPRENEKTKIGSGWEAGVDTTATEKTDEFGNGQDHTIKQ